jgi:hypothetical protein
VFAALGVCEIGAIVLVDGEAEATLEGADVVFEEVRVFVEVEATPPPPNLEPARFW